MSGETVLGRDSEGRVREYALATQGEVDAIPAGGTPTLAEVLIEGNDPDGNEIKAADDSEALGAVVRVFPGDDALAGGKIEIVAGDGITDAGVGGGPVYVAAGGQYDDAVQHDGGFLQLLPGNQSANGKVRVFSNAQLGTAGEALVSDGSSNTVWGGLAIAAGVPAGAPDGKLPIAFDTTAVTGGAYYWNGAAWVKFADLP